MTARAAGATGKRRVAILISGRGSNMGALIEAAAGDAYPAHIVLVVSNRPGAPGLGIAAAAGIPTRTLDHTLHDSREAFEAQLTQLLEDAGAELICLAGFMRLLSPAFIARWEMRVLNIHPSLLPAFKGLHSHARALEAGVRIAGCSVHFVTADMDGGPIIAQAAVPVREGDTPERLAARVLKAEHRLYPEALRLVAGGLARVHGGRVEIDLPLDAGGDQDDDGDLLMVPAPGR